MKEDRILLKYRQHILNEVIHLIFLFDGFNTYDNDIQCLLRNLKIKIENENYTDGRATLLWIIIEHTIHFIL